MELQDWTGWQEWEPILEIEPSRLPSSPGAYMIAYKHSINRAVGVDREGILDIGESNNLRNRIKSFISCAKGEREKGHMAGWRYRAFEFENQFPLSKLWLSWHKTTSKESAYQIEGAMLHEYVKQHKELPPLNYKFNWAEF